MGTPAQEDDITKQPANGDTPPDAPKLPEPGSPDDVEEKKSEVPESDRQIEEGDEQTA